MMVSNNPSLGNKYTRSTAEMFISVNPNIKILARLATV